MKEDRGQWYLLTGLVIGIVLGLVYTWIFQPVEYVNTTPASLRADLKDRYRAMIAIAYLANGDLVRAKARLELLEDDDVFVALAQQAQRTLAEGNSPEEARALGLLAIELGQEAPDPPIAITAAPTMPAPSPTMDANSTPALDPSENDNLSLIPQPTLAFTHTHSAKMGGLLLYNQSTSSMVGFSSPVTSPLSDTPFSMISLKTDLTINPENQFRWVNLEQVCSKNFSETLTRVQVTTIFGFPTSRLMAIVTWEDDGGRFFTAMKSE